MELIIYFGVIVIALVISKILSDRAYIALLKISLAITGSIECPQDELFNPDLLKQIRNLCHPDRHGGSREASEITALINGILEKQS